MSATETSPGVRKARRALLDEELIALLRLRALPGIGDVRGAALIAEHGSAQAALDAARRARPEQPAAAGWIARAIETIDELDIDVIAQWDPRYPEQLTQLHDSPLVVFARGDLSLLECTSVAIVGTRRATEHGLDAAHTMAAGIARFGVVVVSGMALGIDTAAHRAALSVRGATVAVLGAGIDVPYPASNASLHEEIAARGLLVSEFLPGTPPDRPNFVRRNRIIAALAHSVLVIEAPVKSGAQSTVDHALDLNRNVLAVPGPIGRDSCEGTNRLLRDGAAVAIEPADVLDMIGMGAAGARLRAMPKGSAGRMHASRAARHVAVRDRPPPADAIQAALWRAVEWDQALHVDAIAVRAGLDARVAMAGLLQLELDGRVGRGPGMTFTRIG
ncbi:MAG: DNA-processing protein DprA [Longimicrobiales bacterium]